MTDGDNIEARLHSGPFSWTERRGSIPVHNKAAHAGFAAAPLISRAALSMIASAAQALGQMFDRNFRGVLWLGVGCTFALFVLLLLVLQWAVGHVPDFGYVWLHDAIAIVAGALLTVVFVFLGAPVAQLFASIFLDRVATAVERRYYPATARGQGAGFGGGLAAGLTFTGISLVLNLFALPLHFALPLVGTVVVLMINGYLTGRNYFELAALRHITAPEARALRRRAPSTAVFGRRVYFVSSDDPVREFYRAGVRGGDDDARVPKNWRKDEHAQTWLADGNRAARGMSDGEQHLEQHRRSGRTGKRTNGDTGAGASATSANGDDRANGARHEADRANQRGVTIVVGRAVPQAQRSRLRTLAIRGQRLHRARLSLSDQQWCVDREPRPKPCPAAQAKPRLPNAQRLPASHRSNR